MTIFEISKKSGTKKKGVYGSRKISKQINKYTINGKKVSLSRNQVLGIMKEMNIKSKYNEKSFTPYTNMQKSDKYYPNRISQEYDNWKPLEVITSDLTYVKTADGRRYICFIIELLYREIIGYSISKQHDTDYVLQALKSVSHDLFATRIFQRVCIK